MRSGLLPTYVPPPLPRRLTGGGTLPPGQPPPPPIIQLERVAASPPPLTTGPPAPISHPPEPRPPHHDHHHHHQGCGHDHGFGAHHHDYTHLIDSTHNLGLLRTALLIQGAFLVAEIIGGLAFNSIALLADAAHMLADVAAIVIALIAARVAHGRVRDKDGHARPELVAALFNGCTLIVATVVILVESFNRMSNPLDIAAGGAAVVAVLGLAANLVTAMVLRRADGNNLNMQATLAHTVTDAVSSVGVIVGTLIIMATGARILDPLIGVAIALVVLRMAWPLTRQSWAALRNA